MRSKVSSGCTVVFLPAVQERRSLHDIRHFSAARLSWWYPDYRIPCLGRWDVRVRGRLLQGIGIQVARQFIGVSDGSAIGGFYVSRLWFTKSMSGVSTRLHCSQGGWCLAKRYDGDVHDEDPRELPKRGVS